MAKIKLGAAPKSFKRKVSFPLVGGGMGDINVEFMWRNRTQFADFIDSVFPELREQRESGAADGIDVVANSAKALSRDVTYISGCVLSWDLDDEFNEDSIKQLVNEYPAAANAITKAYSEAITEGKAKN